MPRFFLYHRVSDEQDALWPPMTPALFERTVAYMAKHYSVVRLEEWFLTGQPATPKQTAAIVFDDGFRDNLEIAAPILQQYRLPATFYVVTDCINTQLPTWTYQLDYRFQHTQQASLNLPFDFLPEALRAGTFTSPNERLAFGRSLKPTLKKLPHPDRLSVLATVEEQFRDVEIPRVMMNWDEVRQLHRAGFRIESHSQTHTLLATIPETASIDEELAGSKAIIERELGTSVTTISYPIGSYDHRVIAASKSAGYQLGLAVKQRFYHAKQDSLFDISRVELYEEPWWKTRSRMTGHLEAVKRLVRR